MNITMQKNLNMRRIFPIIILDMLYFVYLGKDRIAETDTLDFVKSVARKYPDCRIKEVGSGKVFKPKFVKKEAVPVA